jgi:hypothetical protein
MAEDAGDREQQPATAAGGGGGGGGAGGPREDGGGREESSVKLFVGQVPKLMTEAELAAMFRDVALVDEVTVIRDKATKVSRGESGSVRPTATMPFRLRPCPSPFFFCFSLSRVGIWARFRCSAFFAFSGRWHCPPGNFEPGDFSVLFGPKCFVLCCWESWRFRRNAVPYSGCSWGISCEGCCV